MDPLMFMAFATEADECARLLDQLEAMDPENRTGWRFQAQNASARELKNLICEVKDYISAGDFSV